jgi:hypothetical protein
MVDAEDVGDWQGTSEGIEVNVLAPERAGENVDEGVKVVVEAVSLSEYISDLDETDRS